jgi:hypothetical protein
MLQRKAVTNDERSEVPAIVHDVLRSPGRPLDPATRAFFEPRFGRDFSKVRVHSDAKAAKSAGATGAAAYTVGSHVVFGARGCALGTRDGLRLMAHELAHTIQQKSTTLHPSLEIGRIDDPMESQADRIADAVMSGSHMTAMSSAGGLPILRRTPEEPEPLRSDMVHVPAPARGADARIHVIRKLIPCECRRVPDVREGIFWNPDIDAFAIAYRHCRGGTTADVYGEVESNLSSFLTGGAPPTGTARIGFEVNVVGRTVGGRAVLEVSGSTTPGSEGIGGRAQVVFQGNRWRVFVTSDFLHRLGARSGDELTITLGVRIGPVTAEVQVSDVLSTTPTGTGAGCVDIFGGSARLCGTLSAGGGRGVTPAVELRVPFGGPEVRKDECFQCLCPPPAKRFECYLDIPPTERTVTREIDVEVPGEHRYYFRLDRTLPAEDADLRSHGASSLDAVVREVSGGGSLVGITGYASPEATEAHNARLSADRAETLAGLLRPRLPAGTPLPTPTAGGELLGRRPAPSPTSRLGDAVHASGFRSAEDITMLLLGEEIPNRELADQFVSLFRSLPDPADRLALFGLGPGDSLVPKVLLAIDAFLRNPHAGNRPWERIFRLLRFGSIRTMHSERRAFTETERTTGSLERLSEGECRTRGLEAERRGLLPPVPRELRSPHRGREDRDIECTIDVRPEDSRSGCSYEIPAGMRRAATAPQRAPRPFP